MRLPALALLSALTLGAAANAQECAQTDTRCKNAQGQREIGGAREPLFGPTPGRPSSSPIQPLPAPPKQPPPLTEADKRRIAEAEREDREREANAAREAADPVLRAAREKAARAADEHYRLRDAATKRVLDATVLPSQKTGLVQEIEHAAEDAPVWGAWYGAIYQFEIALELRLFRERGAPRQNSQQLEAAAMASAASKLSALLNDEYARPQAERMFTLMRSQLPDFPTSPSDAESDVNVGVDYYPPGRKRELEALVERVAAVERPAREAERERQREQARDSLPDKQQAAALILEFERSTTPKPYALLDRALKLDPDNPRGWYWRGFADSDYDLDLALRSYERALALAPDDLPTLKAIGALHAYWAKKRPDSAEWPKAIAAYQRALVVRPNDHDVLNDLYRTQFDGRDFAGARDTATVLNGLYPNRSYFMLDLADAQRELGDTAKALSTYRSVAKAADEYSEALYRSAVGLCKLGKARDGLALFQQDVKNRKMSSSTLDSYNECRKAAGRPPATDADLRNGTL